MSTKRQKPCANCGHNNFVQDRFSGSGDISCSKCGAVSEENPIVSEVQFGESSSGAAMVQGAMVSADLARANFSGRQNSMESREQTILNGRNKIKKLATALKISAVIAEAAGNWFKLALTNNFVQGRRSQNVIAACLYVACRKEKTHHMLIDFSSRLQISVYSLGATFLKMVKALHITKLPLADPSLFIQHFAEKLNFGDLNTKVIRDAVKLSHRMANDWIHEGRRPAGIAGACVLLAARMNNFRRSHAEIVAVAHVAEETLQRRLNEFKKTASAELTILSFRDSEVTSTSNPPSYNKNRSLEAKLEARVDERASDLKRVLEKLQKNRIEEAQRITLASMANKENAEEGTDDDGIDDEDENAEHGDEVEDESEGGLFVDDEDDDNLPKLAPSKNSQKERLLRLRKRLQRLDELQNEASPESSDIEETNTQILSEWEDLKKKATNEKHQKASGSSIKKALAKEKANAQKRKQLSKKAVDDIREQQDQVLLSVLRDSDLTETELRNELDRIINRQRETLKRSLYEIPSEKEKVTDFKEQVDLDRPRNLVKNHPKTADMLQRVSSERDLDELDDDDEVFSQLLTPEESRDKERIWTGLNHDYLLDQEQKRLKQEADELTGNTSGQRKRQRKAKVEDNLENLGVDGMGIKDGLKAIGVDEETGEPLTAADSAKRMLAKKPFSKKINYTTLGDLFQDTAKAGQGVGLGP